MNTPPILCTHCQSANNGPHGHNPSGSRRYLCRSCQRHFTPQPKPNSPYSADFKRKVVRHYLESGGLRSIGRLHGLVHQTVANWTSQRAAAIDEQTDDPDPAATIEVDELHTFVGNKEQKVYIYLATTRETRLIVGHAILEHIDAVTLQYAVEPLPAARRYFSDGLPSYQQVVWPEPGEHEVSVGKNDTYTIEGMNAQLRHYLARLRRKTRCFSKSLTALAGAWALRQMDGADNTDQQAYQMVNTAAYFGEANSAEQPTLEEARQLRRVD